MIGKHRNAQTTEGHLFAAMYRKSIQDGCRNCVLGSSSSLHSAACNALGASDGVIHSKISFEAACLRAAANNHCAQDRCNCAGGSFGRRFAHVRVRRAQAD